MQFIDKRVYKIFQYIKFVRENKNWIKYKGDKAILLATPNHGNLGDHLIALAEYNMLEKVVAGIRILEIPVDYGDFPLYWLKIIVKNNPIFITGGGFLGSLWEKEEKMVVEAIKCFKKNPTIIFPQTVFYERTQEANILKKNAIKVFSKRKNVFIFLREKKSYYIAKKLYRKNKVYYAPDMAFSIENKTYDFDRKKILCCFRRDKESIFSSQEKTKLLKIVERKFGKQNIDNTDTVVARNITKLDRCHVLNLKMMEFARHKLVLTDRLHGMIFAYLTNTPCIVFDNKSKKISGVFKMLNQQSFVKLLKGVENLEKELENFDIKVDKENIKYKEYDSLIKVIKKVYM